MRHKHFYDNAQARMYLEGSIVMVDKVPVIAESISDNIMAYRSLSRKYSTGHVDLDSDRVDFTPMPLGFVNFNLFDHLSNVVRAFRIPIRQWRIGLTLGTLSLEPDQSSETRKSILYSKNMENTILNSFPPFEHAIEKVNGRTVNGIAFDREFAIGSNGQLFHLHTQKPVGEIYKKEFKLYDPYMCLSEVLERAMRC